MIKKKKNIWNCKVGEVSDEVIKKYWIIESVVALMLISSSLALQKSLLLPLMLLLKKWMQQ